MHLFNSFWFIDRVHYTRNSWIPTVYLCPCRISLPLQLSLFRSAPYIDYITAGLLLMLLYEMSLFVEG